MTDIRSDVDGVLEYALRQNRGFSLTLVDQDTTNAHTHEQRKFFSTKIEHHKGGSLIIGEVQVLRTDRAYFLVRVFVYSPQHEEQIRREVNESRFHDSSAFTFEFFPIDRRERYTECREGICHQEFAKSIAGVPL